MSKRLILKTPLILAEDLSLIFRNKIFLKLESKQTCGSFKIRGLLNYLNNIIFEYIKAGKDLDKLSISTYTTGNHGIAVAYLARELGIQAKIFAPKDISKTKIDLINQYGKVYLTDTRKEAEELAKSNENFIHPSGHELIIEGISKMVKEMSNQLNNEIYSIFAPCGGGGLLSGLYKGTQDFSPETKIFGCEPSEAKDAYLSKLNGKIFRFQSSPDTIADGLKALALSEISFKYIKLIEKIFLISEDEIRKSFIELSKICRSEASSSLTLAGLYKWHKENPSITKKNIILIISGGNF